MDYLECSRTLMSSAIETHRSIEEIASEDFEELLVIADVIKQSYVFLKKNLEPVSYKFEAWRLEMQLHEPERFSRIARIANNTEKNIRVARKKAIQIEHWIWFDTSVIT